MPDYNNRVSNSTSSAESKNSSSSFLKTDGGKTKSNAIEVPSISLPKGGGAIKGIDEKFSVNAVNGTASFSIPLPFSPARGATPSLNLSYNSGGGNGIFGLGWNLGLSSIKRKTDKGLPQYLDGIDSDTFLFSEAEDLVPEFKKEADGSFSISADGEYIINEKDSIDGLFTTRFYKPRIEGLFARIERWSSKNSGEIKWRVITRDNVTTLFGWSAGSRIADPKDENRIYEWLPEFVFDDKGNCSHFIYKPEDEEGFDTSLLNNRNRLVSGKITYTNTYLEKVLYGNKTPYKNFGDGFPMDTDYFFSTVFDYGTLKADDYVDKVNDWDYRPDAFSDYKSGFEIRTTRLCKRVLLFHHFNGANEYEGLVRSLNFEYAANVEEDFTFLRKIHVHGYIKKNDGTYSEKQLPPMEFTYQAHDWNKEVKTIATEDLVHAPVGLDEQQYQFTDLYNEGLNGILTEQANGWYYKHNLGNGKFEQAKLVTPKPSFMGLGSALQLADLDADGGKQLVSFSNEPTGFFELDDENEWQGFRSFHAMPNIAFNDGNTRMLDLNGDGKPDVVISEETAFTWYPSAGREGFSQAHQTVKPIDDEAGPAIIFADQQQTIFLADMSGSGLSDIVRIRNGETSYWPNLGYGKFGTKVAMDNAPVFDYPDAFNPSFLRLADIDGSGTTDIIYLGKNKFTCWKNLSGNRFGAAPFEIDAFPEIHSASKITVTDLLGNGVACIVWSSQLMKDAYAPLRYIDLMNSKKPHIMVSYKNNMGKEVSMEYTPSTKFYIDDKKAGRPWVTKLHFPVHLLTKTITHDKWTKTTFTSRMSYHHGYYDHAEREFRGFGRVEQIDAEDFDTFASGNSQSPFIIDDLTLYQPPVKTITWYHTGAFLGRHRILNQFESEYFTPEANYFREKVLPPPDLEDQYLSADEWPQALRACKGMVLRQEIFELDVKDFSLGVETPIKLYSTAYHNCHIGRLQPMGENKFAVFQVTESEAITYNYELALRNSPLLPDPRISHSFNLKSDEYGNPLESLAIAYPRILRHEEEGLPAGTLELIAEVQQESLLVFSKNHFTQDIIEANQYRLRLPCEAKTYELTGIHPVEGFYFSIAELRNLHIAEAIEEIPYHILPNRTNPQKRCVEWARILYFSDDLITPLPWARISSLGLPYENYKLALTSGLLDAVFKPGQLSAEVITDLNDADSSGYVNEGDLAGRFPDMDTTGQHWIRSGIAGFSDDATDHFYLPERYTDPFGNTTVLEYDPLDMYVQSTTDAIGNSTEIKNFDYRVLAPCRMIDINGNASEVIFDILGMPTAMALLGKEGEADNLIGFDNTLLHPDRETIIRFFTGEYDETEARRLLGNATASHLYYFGEQADQDGNMEYGNHPPCAAGLLREIHLNQGGKNSPLQAGFEYSNGSGNVLVKKVQAEPETQGGSLRWIANGKTILNNKGKPVKQYEPYFSPNGHVFEEPVEVGVTPIIYYDAAGRTIRTEMPDGTYSRVEFSPWYSKTFDANDTLLEPGNGWYIENSAGTAAQQTAASISAIHADTPAVIHFDSLGRDVIAITHNKYQREEITTEEKYVTYTKLDTEGKPLWIQDARGNRVMEYINTPGAVEDYSPCYDIAGNLLFQHSMDAGDRWMITDAEGHPFYAWDENEKITESDIVHEYRVLHTDYDPLRRPLEQSIKINEAPWQIIERIVYGETQGDAPTRNLKGQVFLHYDSGGLVTNIRFDFKGNLLETTRQLTETYDASLIDWNTEIPAEETFVQRTRYDALNRMIFLENWHRTGTIPATYTPRYNQRGVLKSEVLTVNRVPTKAVLNIKYNVKGQRTRMQYGNGTTTRYHYDDRTFRLKQLRTTRTSPAAPGNLRDPNLLQNLYYTYDPSGNITEVLDKAYELVFFNNQQVKPRSRYTYDALYRLIKAEGRENYQSNAASGQFAEAQVPINFPVEGQTLRNYSQIYTYDGVGNILRMQHIAVGGNWTRNYAYAPGSNRLLLTWIGNDELNAVRYAYDTHGSMQNLANVPDTYHMQWDYRDMIHTVNLGGGGRVFYNYDTAKQRTRKRIERLDGTIEERIYLGGMELYRRWMGSTLAEEIETHHLFVDDQRILIVEHVKETDSNLLDKGLLYKYQYSNHLGSVGLECDGVGNIISYEECHPYGTTAYHATNAAIKATAKRYRYTGMERDEETEMAYHTARYYLPWLGRWVSTDPIGIGDGVNVYEYVSNDPVSSIDTTGKDGLTIQVGSEFDRTSADQTIIADEGELLESGRQMLEQMQTELREYFGIETTISDDRNTLRLLGNSTEEQTQLWDEAYNNAVDLIRENIRSRMTGSTEAAITEREDESINFWLVARARLMSEISDGEVVHLVTNTHGAEQDLLFMRVDWTGLTLSVNPFSFNLQQANADGTTYWVSPIEGSSERALAAFSPTMLFLHETDHFILNDYLYPLRTSDSTISELATAGRSDVEERTVDDVDIAIRSHPGIAKRLGYFGTMGALDDRYRVYVDEDPGEELGGHGHPARAGSSWVLFPSRREVLSGRRTSRR